MFIADLHIHSHYSRATSKLCVPEGLHDWARRKGLDLLGTGDFTHPAWRAELREKLVPGEEGLYRLRPELIPKSPVGGQAADPRFVLSAEISCIYKKGGRVRKVHHVILVPSLDAAQALSGRLEQIGNLHSDGRPILGLDSHDLLEICLTVCPDVLFIPAHIWTPHFSLFGAYSGFDAIEDCFGDLTGHIHALETGLSSDPPMNWRLSALDRFTLVSNSDAHSPANLAREANLFDTGLSYPALAHALAHPGEGGFYGTLEFFPEEGKYHYNGHRACKVCQTPAETAATGGLCPACGKRVTVGVLQRVEALADRPEGFRPAHAPAFERLVPLREVVASALGFTPASARVGAQYDALLGALGSELAILRQVPLEDIRAAAGPLIAEGIARLRRGEVSVSPGYDGEYGKVTVFTKEELHRLTGQLSLLPEAPPPQPPKPPRAAAARPAPAPRKTAPQPPPQVHPYGLSDAQWAAVSASGPALAVIAGPGTGKTHTLVSRIRYLVERQGVPPARITAVTFTNKAAREMRTRLAAALPGGEGIGALQIGTFHALCLGALQQADPERPLALVPEADAQHLAAGVIRAAGLDLSPRDALSRLSRWKNAGGRKPCPLPEAFRAGYQAALSAYGLLDYDDLLLQALALWQHTPPPVSHLLVDEFQDINPVQYALIQALCAGGAGLFAIGDPDQAIYGFRGADPRCFERLADDFEGAQTLRLADNYRSTPQVLQAAAQVLRPGVPSPLTPHREAGEPVRWVRARDPFAQALFVTQAIGRLVGGLDMLEAHGQAAEQAACGFCDIAVLYRTHRQAAFVEQCFAKESIPYHVTGRESFLGDGRVRQAAALLRFLAHPGDLLALGLWLGGWCFGEEALEGVLAAYRAGPLEHEACLRLLTARLPGSPDAALPPPARLLEDLCPARFQSPAEWVQAYCAGHGLSGHPALSKLYQVALTHQTLPGLLRALSLGTEADVSRCGGPRYRPDGVSLMTFHAAKGLEFHTVFLLGLDQGLVPLSVHGSPSEEAEERRLLYVGLTRAASRLVLLSGGEPSPFLSSLSGHVAQKDAFPAPKAPAGEQLSLF